MRAHVAMSFRCMSRPIAAIESALPLVSRLIGILAVLVGLMVAWGWIVDHPTLKSLIPGFPQMKLNAALAFAWAGAALLFVNGKSKHHLILANLCAAAVALIGVTTLSEYFFRWDLHIDQLLIADRSDQGPQPGRIPMAGAINFTLLGMVLLLLDARSTLLRALAQWLALVVISISFVVILGYAYDVSSLYRARSSAPIALHGVILFALLSFGALASRANEGFMARAIASGSGGLLIRRLLPAAILITPLLGWIRLQGEQAGFYGADEGLAIFATSSVLVFSVLIWSTAAAVAEADDERHTAESRLQAQVARLDLLNHITRAMSERQDPSSIFQVVIRSLEDHLPVDFACIASYEREAGALTVVNVGVRNESLAAQFSQPSYARVSLAESGLERAVHGELMIDSDLVSLPDSFAQRLVQAGLRACVIAPLRMEGKVFGLLIVARREPGSFGSADSPFLLQVSEHAALAMHQAKLHDDLQKAYDDLRLSQEALLQQERLRALGQMSSGIAHDINNALSPMSVYTESLLESETGLSARGREQLSTIRRAIDDVGCTVSRMREFSRHGGPFLHLTPVDLNSLVPQVVALTQTRWRDLPRERGVTIDVHTELQANLPLILGVESEIRDTLTNLIFNAVDAMPKGGSLSISTTGHFPAQADSSISEAPRVWLQISDTGIGMDETQRRRCIEPFFTTKGERGTGLGLAMVYGMAQRHGAECEIESTVGSGTVVRLKFPLAGHDGAEDTHSIKVTAPMQPLRILMVDDDPLLIRSLSAELARDGHTIITASGGQSGIDTFLAAYSGAEPFDIVITDLGMPDVDGRKVAEAVRNAAPETPVILLTGWGEDAPSSPLRSAAINLILSKPPTLGELRTALIQLRPHQEVYSTGLLH
jgi:signal transduction histidine kinase/CheY-like chemotaxis protein